MQIKLQSIHFNADIKLVEFIETRINKLNQFSDHIINGEVFLRLDKSTSMENKVTEIKLNMPGKDLFAKKQCKSFEQATDLAIEALRRQIVKYKKKAQIKPLPSK